MGPTPYASSSYKVEKQAVSKITFFAKKQSSAVTRRSGRIRNQFSLSRNKASENIIIIEDDLEDEPEDVEIPVPRERSLEEEVDYLKQAVEELKSKVSRPQDDVLVNEPNYKSLYLDSQKEIEALKYELSKKTEIANGKKEEVLVSSRKISSKRKAVSSSSSSSKTSSKVKLPDQSSQELNKHEQTNGHGVDTDDMTDEEFSSEDTDLSWQSEEQIRRKKKDTQVRKCPRVTAKQKAKDPIKEKALEDFEKSAVLYPQFKIGIQPIYLSHASLNIPMSFAAKYLKVGKSEAATLQAFSNSWRVTLTTYHNGCSKISKGWLAFAKQNRIQEGDICLFELLDTTNYTFRVTLTNAEDCSALPKERGVKTQSSFTRQKGAQASDDDVTIISIG